MKKIFLEKITTNEEGGKTVYYEEKRRKKERLIMSCFMVIIISLLLILIIKSGDNQVSTIAQYNAQKVNFDENLEQNKTTDIKQENVIENSVKAIVGISKLKQSGSSIFVNRAEEKLGLGSGVIITDNGYILTDRKSVV